MLIAILLLITVFVVVLLWHSTGKLPDYFKYAVSETGKNSSKSIFEKLKLQINGVKQGLFIVGSHVDNPIILFLHGGPGSPVIPLMDQIPIENRLENSFTICYWEQRGACMSYSRNLDEDSMTTDQLIADTIKVTEYLIKRFNHKKIYLMGYSWGSYLGMKVALQCPEYYHAYIGIGQVTNQNESEKLGYMYLLAKAKALSDNKAINQLLAYDIETIHFSSSSYITGPRLKYMNQYGVGMQHKKYSILIDAKSIFFFKGYTVKEKLNYLKGMSFSMKFFTLDENFFQTIKKFPIPIYFMQGKYDYQTSYNLAKKYFDEIEAVEKGFLTFNHSAHSPMVEEPALFLEKMETIHNHLDKFF